MSVLIKMEMPTSCDDCALCYPLFLENDDICWTCAPLKRTVDSKARRKNCPLIEIKPHGRLIDADVLLEDCPELTPYEQIMKMETIIEAEGEET